MFSLRNLLAASRAASEGRVLRRLTKIWLATGTVPVAHMVADSDDAAATVSLALRPAVDAGHRVLPC